MRKPEMAECLKVTPEAITKWVAKGIFPPPALRPGDGMRVQLWRYEHFLAYLETGQWPEEAFR